MSANQLYLLADHIKLSLLERQRAQSLNLPEVGQQDTQISRSLSQFKSGLDGLEKEENTRLLDTDDVESAAASTSTITTLRKQLDDLTSQFHGFSSPSTTATLTHPNDPSLQGDFEHAQSTSSATLPPSRGQLPRKTSLRVTSGGGGGGGGGGTGPNTTSTSSEAAAAANKTVRFSDNPQSAAGAAEAADEEAQLFGRYRDDPVAAAVPPPDNSSGYRDVIEGEGMGNQQIHAYHDQVLRDQDDQLDSLGATIGRQRELSMRIGDELDGQVQLLDEMDTNVERHTSGLERARKGIGKVAKGVGESKQMMIIIALIMVLILLIAVTK